MRSRFSAWSSTTSTRAISGHREGDRERASGPERAVHEDLAAEQLGQLLADVEAEPGPLEFPGLRLPDLLEGAEEPVLVLGRDAHPRVGNAQPHRAPVAGQA